MVVVRGRDEALEEDCCKVGLLPDVRPGDALAIVWVGQNHDILEVRHLRVRRDKHWHHDVDSPGGVAVERIDARGLILALHPVNVPFPRARERGQSVYDAPL